MSGTARDRNTNTGNWATTQVVRLLHDAKRLTSRYLGTETMPSLRLSLQGGYDQDVVPKGLSRVLARAHEEDSSSGHVAK